MGGSTGMTGIGKAGNYSCTFSYKRIPDIQGKYKLVAQQGVDSQMTALGMSQEEKAKMAPIYLPVYNEIKPMGEGIWKYIAEGDYPEVEFNFEKEYTYTWMGETFNEVATYTPNMRGLIMVSKVGQDMHLGDDTHQELPSFENGVPGSGQFCHHCNLHPSLDDITRPTTPWANVALF